MLEMKVGSVLSSHFKNLSTSFLGLLLVLCNSLCVNCILSIFMNIGRPRNYTTHTIKNYQKLYRSVEFTPISYRYHIEIKILISHTTTGYAPVTRLAKTELSASINMPKPGEDPNTSSNNGVDENDPTNDSIIEKYCAYKLHDIV